jgi:hypothetical protein
MTRDIELQTQVIKPEHHLVNAINSQNVAYVVRLAAHFRRGVSITGCLLCANSLTETPLSGGVRLL